MSPFWPFGRRPAPAPTEEGPEHVEFHSRALPELLQPGGGGTPSYLDLGPADNVNLAFFSGRGARYAVEDLHGTLEPCRSAGRIDPKCMRELSGLLTFSEGTEFDVVLGWDLLNYLDLQGLAVLTERLLPWTHLGTLWYFLISREQRLPARPRHFEIAGRETVRHSVADTRNTLPSPRYNQPPLEHALAPFGVHRGYLLKVGFQEYVFMRR